MLILLLAKTAKSSRDFQLKLSFLYIPLQIQGSRESKFVSPFLFQTFLLLRPKQTHPQNYFKAKNVASL